MYHERHPFNLSLLDKYYWQTWQYNIVRIVWHIPLELCLSIAKLLFGKFQPK